MKFSNRNNKILAVFLSLTMLCLTACSSFSSNPVDLLPTQEHKLTALLGDLKQYAPKTVTNQIGTLLHKAETITMEREGKGDYEMSQKEYKIWRKITKLLDKETIKQFGKFDDNGDQKDKNFDYGKPVLKNLKNIMSKEDYEKIISLREEYFSISEGIFKDNVEDDRIKEDSSEDDIYNQIKKIADKYKNLDGDAVALNLIDDKNNKNLAIFYITPDYKVVYQSGLQNGLNVLTELEQKSLEKNWKAVTDILPANLFANFKYFKVGGDGELGTLAYVIPLDKNGKTWCMTVDPDDIKDDGGAFPYTVVHEMAHYISLNENQVDYISDYTKYYPINRYNDGQCVAKDNSYLQEYYNMFWEEIINDWETNTENPYFYFRHNSEFVTPYSATSCAEDFSESFAAYILMDKADTPQAQKKFDFFANYPEFNQLKHNILENIKRNNVYVYPNIKIDYTNIADNAA